MCCSSYMWTNSKFVTIFHLGWKNEPINDLHFKNKSQSAVADSSWCMVETNTAIILQLKINKFGNLNLLIHRIVNNISVQPHLSI